MFQPVKVKIQSFQSIEDIEFDVEGFTCVTGKTNIGKSSIMRSISGALLNKPVTNLIRTGAKSCSVRLSSEQWGLLWEKAERGLNRYTIDGKSERLENVGQRQPEPVAAMGFGSVRVGDRDLYPWYASQWAPVFLLDEGGPTVTQFISEISGLDVLQNAITLGLKSKKKLVEESKTAAIEAVRFKQNLSKVDKLDSLAEIVGELDNQAESIVQYETRVEKCKKFHLEISNAYSAVMLLDGFDEIQIPFEAFGDDIKRTVNMNRLWTQLEIAAKAVIALRGKNIDVPEAPTKFYDDWAKIRKYDGIDDLKKSAEKLEPVGSLAVPSLPDKSEVDEAALAEKMQSNIERLQGSVNALELDVQVPDSLNMLEDLEKVGTAKKMFVEINSATVEIKQLDAEFAQATKDLNSVLKELGKIPSCPTCSRPLITQDHSHTHS